MGDAKAQKIALQTISSLYRSGHFIPADRLAAIEGQIIYLLLSVGQDLKVIRWGLNALAQCGRWTTCKYSIESAIRLYAGNPEIEAAGAAALCKMLSGHTRDIEALNAIDPIIWKLAALQTCTPSRIDLSGIKININTDNVDVLKLALITIGVNRDIENLFDPKHSNGTFVRELCDHDDKIVQQYCVWAVTENSRLDLSHLGFSFDRIENLTPNVQSKMYQLAAEKLPDYQHRLNIIEQGSCAEHLEAREGLAKGVRKHYFDGLETAILPWFEQETDVRIRSSLAEHFAAFSDDCGPYFDKAEELFDDEIGLRERILIGAEGKRLYGHIKGKDSPDLFSLLGDKHDLSEIIKNASRFKKMPQLNVCMLLASPKNETPLRLDEEIRDALEKLKLVNSPQVQLNIMHHMAVRLSDFTDHLLNTKPRIVHFSGHGGGGTILFEDAQGEGLPLTANALADIIDAVEGVECVILNACNSSDLASAVRPHVQVVIGCDDSIADDAAITFTKSFYRSLAHGRDYRQSFKIAVADVKAQNGPDEGDKYILI